MKEYYLSWQAENIFFGDQLLSEVNIIGYIFKFGDVDSDLAKETIVSIDWYNGHSRANRHPPSYT